jgi:hypothetical protein
MPHHAGVALIAQPWPSVGSDLQKNEGGFRTTGPNRKLHGSHRPGLMDEDLLWTYSSGMDPKCACPGMFRKMDTTSMTTR